MYDSKNNLFNNELEVYMLNNFQIDYKQLEHAFLTQILAKHMPVWQETYRFDRNKVRKLQIKDSKKFTFGGWSLLGIDENYDSGWTPDGEWLSFSMPKIDDTLYTKKTNLCIGIFSDIVDQLRSMNLNPCRMRITISKPNCDIAWHSDTIKNTEIFRLHIPIITNSSVRLCSATKKWHLPATGNAFIFNAHKLHKVENTLSNRFHIMTTINLNSKIYKNLIKLNPIEEGNYLLNASTL